MLRLGRIALCVILGGCAGDPVSRLSEANVVTVRGDAFLHKAVLPDVPPADAVVHLYIESDGRAFVARDRVARDPTPRSAPALELMTLDPAPRAWLGRPCYFGLATSPGCSPELWTDARYGEQVVASMVAAKRALLGRRPVVLIGHSGGGTVAWLMAARMPETVGLLTIAANLDVQGWARLHGYTPLRGSLDPAHQPPLPVEIRQRHLAGERDQTVPTGLLRGTVPAGTLCEVPGFDHTCCWTRIWPEALRLLEESPEAKVTARLCGDTGVGRAAGPN